MEQKKWYNNKILTNLLLIIFFPIGLYALWKSQTIAKWWKITATVLIALIVIANLGNDNKSSSNNSISTDNSKEENCNYSKLEIKAFQVGTDKLLSEKLLSGCFTKKVVDKSLGLVEVTDNSGTIKISYYIESDPNILRFLDIKLSNAKPSKWRVNKGHDLFMSENESGLNFVFGDRKETKIKGTIRFFN